MRSAERIYSLVLALYPRRFREEYGAAALDLFRDRWETERGWERLRLFFDVARDVAASLPAEHARQEHLAANIPMFYECAPDMPGRIALINGAIVSLAAFAAVILFMGSRATAHYLIGSFHPSPSHLMPAPATAPPVDLDSEVKVKPVPDRPPRSQYFERILVLRALDVDQDNEISAEEIANAAAALTTLDRNHDGHLDSTECGFHVWGSRAEDPVFVARAGKAFMRDHPVLAALDADHDGIISAREIRNASAALARLDTNGDGKLVEGELRPEPAALQVSQALLIYDLDGDGRISQKEFVSRPSRMDFFTKVDRDRDGFLTRDELLEFFRAAQLRTQLRAK